MSKTKILVDGKYTLEFNADSFREMEKRGVDFSKLEGMPFTAMQELWCGAFEANHKDVSRKTRLDLLKDIKSTVDNEKIMDVIGKMATEAIEEIQNPQGNIGWQIV